ncbi:hypothetical protein K7432_006054 [Basidiobolus ranarum]|uniref:Uncharacterized protein n=1 Tax=Basidiobolus ranarum TaxID=34480 RepID=A0ABR2W367_9FUNG
MVLIVKTAILEGIKISSAASKLSYTSGTNEGCREGEHPNSVGKGCESEVNNQKYQYGESGGSDKYGVNSNYRKRFITKCLSAFSSLDIL